MHWCFCRFDTDWTLKGWVDELIPGCGLHHFNLSGIDISLLNNKASKQLLPVHSTWTGNPLEVSNLRFKCCARVRGENARLDPRYHIWTPRGCQTKQATVLSDMSLGLCFGCFDWRFFCWCRGLVHLYLSREASAKVEKNHLTCRRSKLRWLQVTNTSRTVCF